MKKTIFLFSFLLLALPSHAPSAQMLLGITGTSSTLTPIHIQSCGYQAGASENSVACPGLTIGAGHLLIVCVESSSGSLSGGTLSGDSGTFTPRFSNVASGNGNQNVSTCGYIASAGGGGTTITFTKTGMTYAGITWDEWKNVGAFDTDAPPVVVSGGTSMAASPITPTANGDLIVSFFNTGVGNGTITAGGSFLTGAYNTFATGQFYYVQPTAGAITATATASSAPYATLSYAAAFKHQ